MAIIGHSLSGLNLIVRQKSVVASGGGTWYWLETRCFVFGILVSITNVFAG